jgi:hypothetical protein
MLKYQGHTGQGKHVLLWVDLYEKIIFDAKHHWLRDGDAPFQIC